MLASKRFFGRHPGFISWGKWIRLGGSYRIKLTLGLLVDLGPALAGLTYNGSVDQGRQFLQGSS